MPDDLPRLTVAELDKLCADLIAEIQADMDDYDERVSMLQPDDGKPTDRRAIEALNRPERFVGQHQVAVVWLMNSRTARLWGKKS